jgi:3-phenylpropionate/trans-cinnamate dioxygenase ferredoxin reductase subunit
MSHIVVIGAGQAGSSCVVKLRNSGFEGQITLIGEENVPPYQRPRHGTGANVPAAPGVLCRE